MVDTHSHTHILDAAQQTYKGSESAPACPVHSHKQTLTNKYRRNTKGQEKKNAIFPDPIFLLLPWGTQNKTIVVCPLLLHSSRHLSLFLVTLHNSVLHFKWISYMIDINWGKKGLFQALEPNIMPSPFTSGCDCMCGIGLFSLVYCTVTFVLCGVVLR